MLNLIKMNPEHVDFQKEQSNIWRTTYIIKLDL